LVLRSSSTGMQIYRENAKASKRHGSDAVAFERE
jgi:hypothetical protein